MNLTTAQKTAFATHINANTNAATIPGSGGQTFVVNTAVAGRDPTLQQGIADWYNAAAKAGDNQPFANRNVWNPITTIAQLKAAMKFGLNSVLQGSNPTDAQVSNALLMWQFMLWDLGPPQSGAVLVGLDMGDAQVRAGVLALWGDVTSGVANAQAIGGVGCGQQTGRNVELVLSNAVTAVSVGGAFTAAHPIQKDAGGLTVYGQTITAIDVDKALFPNS